MLDQQRVPEAELPTGGQAKVSPLVKTAGVMALVAAGLLTTEQAQADCRWTTPKTDVAPGAPVVVDVNGSDAKSAIRVKEGVAPITARDTNAAGPHMATGVSATLTAPTTPGIHKVVLTSDSCPRNERDKTIFIKVGTPSAGNDLETQKKVDDLGKDVKKVKKDLKEHTDKPALTAHPKSNDFRLILGGAPSVRHQDTTRAEIRFDLPFLSNKDLNAHLIAGVAATYGVGHIPTVGLVGGAQDNGRTTWATVRPLIGGKVGFGGETSTYREVKTSTDSDEVTYKRVQEGSGNNVVEMDATVGLAGRTQSGVKEPAATGANGEVLYADGAHKRSVAFVAEAGISVYFHPNIGVRAGVQYEGGNQLLRQGDGKKSGYRYDVYTPFSIVGRF